MSDKPYQINISTQTFIKAIIIILGLAFLYLIRDIIAIIFVALIFASAFDHWVDYLAKWKVPRAVSMVLIYVIILSLLTLAVHALVGPIREQVADLSYNSEQLLQKYEQIRNYLEERGLMGEVNSFLDSLKQGAEQGAKGAFGNLVKLFGGIFAFGLFLIITFYMVAQENAFKKLLHSFVPAKYQPYIMQMTNRLQTMIGNWLKGQLILMLAAGVFVFIFLKLFGVEYALVLAFATAIFEIVPILGPLVAGATAVFLTYLTGPMWQVVIVLIFYILYHWIENSLLVPKIMKKAVGLNPLVSIIVLMIGMKLAGIAGALISIPVATAIGIIVKDLLGEPE